MSDSSHWVDAPESKRYVQMFQAIETSLKPEDKNLLRKLSSKPDYVGCKELCLSVFSDVDESVSNGRAASKVMGRLGAMGRLIFKALNVTNPRVRNRPHGNPQCFWPATTLCSEDDGKFFFQRLPQVCEALVKLEWGLSPKNGSRAKTARESPQHRRVIDAPEVVSSDDIIDVEQAAKIIGVTPRRVRKLCSEGRPGRRLGGKFIMMRHEVEEFAKIERPPGPRRGLKKRKPE